MELKDFSRPWVLQGIDSYVNTIDSNAQAYAVMLSDKVYLFQEDPDDGYRSYLLDVEILKDYVIKNRIPPVVVRGKYGGSNEDIIRFYDCSNQKKILEVGTDNTDDWYPYAILHWYPQNIHYNMR